MMMPDSDLELRQLYLDTQYPAYVCFCAWAKPEVATTTILKEMRASDDFVHCFHRLSEKDLELDPSLKMVVRDTFIRDHDELLHSGRIIELANLTITMLLRRLTFHSLFTTNKAESICPPILIHPVCQTHIYKRTFVTMGQDAESSIITAAHILYDRDVTNRTVIVARPDGGFAHIVYCLTMRCDTQSMKGCMVVAIDATRYHNGVQNGVCNSICYTCGTPKLKLKFCACKQFAYCGRECQKKDWPRHRTSCTCKQ